MRRHSVLLAIGFLMVAIVAWRELLLEHRASAQGSFVLQLETVTGSLSNPVFVTHAGDGSGRLFIVEQAGLVRIFQSGSLLSAPFLDIRNRVTSGGERGLLSIAFHPNFRENRRFFVNYTHERPTLKTFIAEYQASLTNSNLADPTERVLLEINQLNEFHNGGQLHFGPDGYLFVGMGDGGSGGDVQNYAQSIDSLLGKMLRIDVDTGTPYANPAGNPFQNRSGADEIWALGFRNPWRFSFDRLTGRLFAGDVGQDSREEVDLIERAGNYGWRRFEGTLCWNRSRDGCENPPGMFLPPIAEYGRTEGISVTGGYVYRGRLFPELAGTYIFGDFGTGRIWGLSETNRGTWTRTELLRSDMSISSFGEDEDGELYLVDYAGALRRIRVANPQPASSRLVLLPSAARSGSFVSSLTVVNSDAIANQATIVSRKEDGTLAGSMTVTLAPGAAFQSDDILGALVLPVGAFGPITVASGTGQPLIAASEIRSFSGTAGYFAGKSRMEASLERIIPEVADTGDRGAAGTFRTNLGVNNLGSAPANVRVRLVDDAGQTRGSYDLTVPAFGMVQVNGIVRQILGETWSSSGYLKLTSDQPIQAWASKIDNRTDDPSFETAIGPSASDSGPRLLIPSVARGRFTSSLVLINQDETQTVDCRITARLASGGSLTANKVLPPNAAFRSADILGELGASMGAFGPLTIETLAPVALAAVSEVRSASGTGGFFPAVSLASAAVRMVIAEIVDTGNEGTAGTFRTNLGLNNVGTEEARVQLELVDSASSILGRLTTTVASNEMRQIDHVARAILARSSPTGTRGYIRIASTQPLHAWASKIDNGTDDLSILMGTP